MLRRAALCVLAMVLAASTIGARAVGNSDVSFSSTSVSGSNGTSFVYFQARDWSGSVSAVPTRRFAGCPTAYYMRWVNVVQQPDGSTSYDVQIYSCSTGQPVNDGISRAGVLIWTPG